MRCNLAHVFTRRQGLRVHNDNMLELELEIVGAWGLQGTLTLEQVQFARGERRDGGA